MDDPTPDPPLVCAALLDLSLAQLRAEYGVRSSARPGDRFFSLNYDQYTARPLPLVDQCRGLVLGVAAGPLTAAQVVGSAPVGPTLVFARPFDRFFQLGTARAAPVDPTARDARIYEKLDGTCCIVYFNPATGAWEVGTRAVPRGDQPVDGWSDLTFRTLFGRALAATTGRTFEAWAASHLDLYRGWTFVCEVTAPENRVVVDHAAPAVHLLGARRAADGAEVAPELTGALIGLPPCPHHDLALDAASELPVGLQLRALAETRPPTAHEGFVVCDAQFRRAKVTSAAYRNFSYERDRVGSSPRNLLAAVLDDRDADLVAALPPDRRALAARLRAWLAATERELLVVGQQIVADAPAPPADRKHVAQAALAAGLWLAPLMERYAGRCTGLRDWLRQRRRADGAYPQRVLDEVLARAAGPGRAAAATDGAVVTFDPEAGWDAPATPTFAVPTSTPGA